MGKKHLLDTVLVENRPLSRRYSMLILQLPDNLDNFEVLPGQFVEVQVAVWLTSVRSKHWKV